MSLQLATVIIGWISTVLLTIFNIPQLIKIIKTKNVDGLNRYSYISILLGATLFGLAMAFTNAGGKPIIQTYFAEITFVLMTLPVLFYILKSQKKLLIFWLFTILLAIIFIVGALGMIFDWYEKTSANKIAITLNIIGTIGITGAFMPQTINFIKKKEVEGYSLFTGLMYCVAITMLFIFLLMNGIQATGINKIATYFGAGMQIIGLMWQVIMILITIKYRR